MEKRGNRLAKKVLVNAERKTSMSLALYRVEEQIVRATLYETSPDVLMGITLEDFCRQNVSCAAQNISKTARALRDKNSLGSIEKFFNYRTKSECRTISR